MKHKKPRIKEPLPELIGCKIEEKTPSLEFMGRNREQWYAIVRRLEVLSGSEVISIPLDGVTDPKKRAASIKSSVTRVMKQVGLNKPLRACLKDNCLKLWVN